MIPRNAVNTPYVLRVLSIYIALLRRVILLLANYKIRLESLKKSLRDLSIESILSLMLTSLKLQISLFLLDFTSLNAIAGLLGAFPMVMRE